MPRLHWSVSPEAKCHLKQLRRSGNWDCMPTLGVCLISPRSELWRDNTNWNLHETILFEFFPLQMLYLSVCRDGELLVVKRDPFL